MKSSITVLILLLSLFTVNTFAVSYFIDGYVVIETLFLPVENQIVEIRNEGGTIIASALTNQSGYYSLDLDLPVSAQTINMSLSRNCSGEVVYYNHEMNLNNFHIGYTFLVCEDQICNASFNYEQQSRNNLIFEFTNISDGNIESYFWNFGDGNSSTEQNPVHEYSQQNDYIVSLTINGQNCTDAEAREVDVHYRDCLAKFSFNQVNQGQQLVIEFKNESQGNNLQYLWQFGSSGSSYEMNPSYAFGSPGNYLVTLNVAHPPGSFHSLTKIVEVAPLSGCFALFQNEQIFSSEMQMQFADLSVGKDILHWVWQFGDGSSSTKQNPLHVYTEPGIFTTSLRVISASAQSYYSQDIEIVESSGCQAGFEYTQPNPDNPQINFYSLTANGDLQFNWDFGDGDSSTEKSPAHQYTDFGSYQVTLSVLGYGCTDTTTQEINIEEPVYCEAKFNYLQAYPQSRQIDFIDQSYGDNIIYSWNFGDGETSTLTNPVHNYQTSGDYSVKLLINTSKNCIDSAFATIQILPPLTISGSVYAGSNLLNSGRVNLYQLLEQEMIEFSDISELLNGHFEFNDLLPGDYFVQAIPEFNFPFPIIPFYYPIYSQDVTQWQDAEVLHTDALPQEYILNLGFYNDFFDGKATISGRINQAEGNELPLIIYLCNNANEIFQFSIADQQLEFSFRNIPYGDYKLRPEKPGKTSEAFGVSPNENDPEKNNIVFLETSTSIIPDLSLMDENGKNNQLVLYPNPTTDFLKIHLINTPPQQPIHMNIYSSQTHRLLFSKPADLNKTINVSGFSNGLYIVEIKTANETLYRKLLVRH